MALPALGHYLTCIVEDVGIFTSLSTNERIRPDSACERVASFALRIFGGVFTLSAAGGVVETVSGLLVTKESQIALFATIGLGVAAHDCIRVGANMRKNCEITDRSTQKIDKKAVKKFPSDVLRLGKNAHFENRSALPYFLRKTILLKPVIGFLKTA